MNEIGLLPYQLKSVKHLASLLRTGQNAVDGSDCGVGKTFVAGGVIRELDLPTLVLAPQISLTEWRRMGEKLGVQFDVRNPEMIQTSRTPFGWWDHPRPKKLETELICDRCQQVVDPKENAPCRCQRNGIHCVDPRTKSHQYGKFNWHPNIKLLVFDEVHRFGALDSLNSEMLIAARRQRIRVLGLSATAAENPLQLRALGYVLGLHELVDSGRDDRCGFYRFAFRMGCRKHPFGGWYFAGDESERKKRMGELRQLIFPSRGVRVCVADLGDAFPERQITTELYDLGSRGQTTRLDALYATMDGAIQTLNEARQRDVDLSHPLTCLLRARQEIELIMVPIYEELAKQYLENGLHVALFVNFQQTMDELSKRLKTNCRIEGKQSHALRQRYLDDFGDDKESIILVNNAAGGVSINLHDRQGKFPRVGIVSLGYSAVQTRQVLCRLWRQGAKSKVLYRIPLIAGTVQEKIHRALTPKLNQLDSLNDGDLWATNLPLTRHKADELFPET